MGKTAWFYSVMLVLAFGCSVETIGEDGQGAGVDGDGPDGIDEIEFDNDFESEQEDTDGEGMDGDQESCDDGDPCTVDVFKAETGACSYSAYCADENRTICAVGGDGPSCLCDPGFMDDGDGLCVPGVPDGNDCSTPVYLDLSVGLISGSTGDAASDYGASCNGNTGRDVVYYFHLNGPVRLKLHATGFDTVMFIRTECDNAESELACSDDEGGNLTSLIDWQFLAGTYFLFISGFMEESGAFELNIEIVCGEGEAFNPESFACEADPCSPNPCTDEHETVCIPVFPDDYVCNCDDGYMRDLGRGICIIDTTAAGRTCINPLILEVVPEGSVSGSTVDAGNDYNGRCNHRYPSGPELVFEFTLESTHLATFLMTGFDTLLYLRSDCEERDSEIRCNDDTVGQSAWISSFLGHGTYYLFADSFEEPGQFELTYSLVENPCDADPCPGIPECVSEEDWSGYSCVCPDGYLPFGESCIDDPCFPNPCLESNRNKCAPDLPESHHCDCNLGYIEGEGSACILNPDGNDWAFLVYLNADNNLEEDGYIDIAEMAVAGSTPDVHIVVQFDSYSRDDGATRRLYITEGGYEVVEELGEADMGDWRTLADFGSWAVETFPARHYAMIVWDHGNGWSRKSGDTNESPPFKSFSTDSHGSDDGISVSGGEYEEALQAIHSTLGRKLDIVGFDACLMGTWELAETTKPYADYFVASEDTIPVTGWSYEEFLAPLIADPDMNPLELSENIVETYYQEMMGNSTLSVIDLNSMSSLTRMVSGLANKLMDYPELYAAVENQRRAAQNFSYEDEIRDLGDIALRLGQMPDAPADLVNAAQTLLNQLDQAVKYNRAQSDYPGATGMTIYFPGHDSTINASYTADGAVWSQRSFWDEFLYDFCR